MKCEKVGGNCSGCVGRVDCTWMSNWGKGIEREEDLWETRVTVVGRRTQD